MGSITSPGSGEETVEKTRCDTKCEPGSIALTGTSPNKAPVKSGLDTKKLDVAIPTIWENPKEKARLSLTSDSPPAGKSIHEKPYLTGTIITGDTISRDDKIPICSSGKNGAESKKHVPGSDNLFAILTIEEIKLKSTGKLIIIGKDPTNNE